MPNNMEAFFESLTAASGDFNASTVGNLSFLQGVYLDIGTESARAGETIQIPYPDVGPFENVGAQDWTPENLTPEYASLVFNQRPGKAILLHDFDQFRTSTQLLERLFIQPMYNRGQEFLNGLIAAQVTPANFNVNGIIAGATPGTVTIADSAEAWNRLATAKAPMSNSNDLSLFVHNDVYKNMMLDKDRYQESLVGAVIAQNTRQNADLGVAFNFRNRYDQQASGAPLAYTGTVTAAGGSPALVGTGTAFTTQMGPGSTFQLAGDTKVYTVLSIQDATHLTATENITAGAGKVMSTPGYLALAAHRYAIALGLRPLELVNDGNVQSRLILLSGIPFRVMTSYQHLKGGWLLTMDVGAACGVIRPDFGVLINV